jgi:hypothetical protein
VQVTSCLEQQLVQVTSRLEQQLVQMTSCLEQQLVQVTSRLEQQPVQVTITVRCESTCDNSCTSYAMPTNSWLNKVESKRNSVELGGFCFRVSVWGVGFRS